MTEFEIVKKSLDNNNVIYTIGKSCIWLYYSENLSLKLSFDSVTGKVIDTKVLREVL